MILVLFLLGILLSLILIIEIVLLSELKINIINLETQNELFIKNQFEYDIEIRLYLLGAIPYFKYNLNKNILSNNKFYRKIREISSSKNLANNINAREIFNLLSLKFEKINLNLQVGTSNAALTAYAVFAVSTILELSIPYLTYKHFYKNIKYKIIPLYNGRNILNIKLNSIICIKMVHIISVIYIILQKRRDKKNERASNRRTYANSYE